jgi:Uma2 family endonuclease
MSLSTSTTQRATLEDLERVEGKVELIAGRIVKLPASGHRHNYVAGRLYIRLMSHADSTTRGYVYTDSMGFVVHELRSGRESFSPDVAFYDGPLPADERDFVEGPPTLAVEVRGKNDYGKTADRELAAKRADYFEAGTLVVWDVDPDTKSVHVYRAAAPDRPDTFTEGQEADAEPAVPGWRISVDEIFR